MTSLRELTCLRGLDFFVKPFFFAYYKGSYALLRKANLDAINPQAIVQAAMRYNHTPRKCLDFLTPDEAFNRFKSTVALQT